MQQESLAAEPWMAEAVCAGVDADLWFPEKGGDSRAAKRICVDCPVRQQCLDYALERHEVGIWGGTSEIQRRRMRQKGAA